MMMNRHNEEEEEKKMKEQKIQEEIRAKSLLCSLSLSPCVLFSNLVFESELNRNNNYCSCS
jgi:hypothetical protein